jgi:signal transduction histidine kinase
MPDGTPTTPAENLVAARAAEADARLIRDVRWRLVAWSGGITLLILFLLGVALYAAVANSLATSSTAQLEGRAREILESLDGPRRPRAQLGFNFGGHAGGTFALLIDPQGERFLPQGEVPDGLPDDGSAAAARDGRRNDVRTTHVGTDAVPVRVLSWPVESRQGTFVIQVVQDRTAEQQTLRTTLLVLLGGGVIALLAAAGFGAVYARRALIPIRDSLSAQHAALRRQREFAADASHELRTPLTVIRSSVDDLRRHPNQPVAKVGHAIEDIDAEVEHLTTLVDDLLLLARSDSGAVTLERTPVDLGDVATDAASSLGQPAASKGIKVVVDPEPAVVVGDAARLRQLVRILVDNAIRHSPSGGEVTVRVRPNGRSASIEVADQGPGVRPQDMSRIFERFWRAPGAPTGGTGLGLAIAKWIVDRHDGHIEVGNRTGGGAVFSVDLPTADAAAG